jgi:GNAT superfamily N-acetyltransferase
MEDYSIIVIEQSRDGPICDTRIVIPESVIRTLKGNEVRTRCSELADILIACVEGGASVSFMSPLPRETAERFWHSVEEGVNSGDRALLVAEDSKTQKLVGTVQLLLKQPENQPHRADLAKMLVAPDARRRGIGAQLMRAAEASAQAAGKKLLVLDAAAGCDAERLYERLGWIRPGVIPNYALWPALSRRHKDRRQETIVLPTG